MSLTPTEIADRFFSLLQQRTATQDSEEVRNQFFEHFPVLEKALETPEARDAILARLASFLTPECPEWEFACTANTCGMAVEAGGDPALALDPILTRLPSLLSQSKELSEAVLARFGTANLEAVPEDQVNAAAQESSDFSSVVGRTLATAFLGRSAMTMLCRSIDLRKKTRTREELLQAVVAARDYSPYAFYMYEVLGSSDDEEIVVLDLQREIGFRIKTNGVRNNFHLFTLLQAELLSRPEYADWAGAKQSQLITDIARGSRLIHTVTSEEFAQSAMVDEKGEVFNNALWTYYQWPAVQPDGTLETAKDAEPYQPWWAWGEWRPFQLADLDGVRLLLLGELEMPRSWGMGFFSPLHPAFQSEVRIEKVLSKESVKGWLDEIRAVPREANTQHPVGMSSDPSGQ